MLESFSSGFAVDVEDGRRQSTRVHAVVDLVGIFAVARADEDVFAPDVDVAGDKAHGFIDFETELGGDVAELEE